MDSSHEGRAGNAHVHPIFQRLLSAYAPTPEAEPQAPWFRVAADWAGGGFAFTLQFNDAQAATDWAVERTKHRRDVSVHVEQRPPIECTELSAQEVDAIAADLHVGAMKKSGEWDERRLDRGQGL